MNGGFILSHGEKTRITVEIYGQQYVVVGHESKEHIRQVARIVDDKMREIGRRNPSLTTNQLAVLTAINAVHEYMKLKEKVKELEQEIKKRRVD